MKLANWLSLEGIICLLHWFTRQTQRSRRNGFLNWNLSLRQVSAVFKRPGRRNGGDRADLSLEGFGVQVRIRQGYRLQTIVLTLLASQCFLLHRIQYLTKSEH